MDIDRGSRAILAVAMMMMSSQAPAQESEPFESEFLNRAYGYPAFTPKPTDYNLRWRAITGRLYGSLQLEYTDNINLADSGAEADLAIGPFLGLEFLWPMARNQFMQFELGIGYRWYVDHSELNSLIIVPNTRWNYRVAIEDVEFRFRDSFTIQNDPTRRAELSGSDSGGSTLEFHRLNNTAGLTASWQPIRPLSAWLGYDYYLDRSLSGQFEELDRDDHLLGAGVDYIFSPVWTVGLNGLVTLTEYSQDVQNNGLTYTVGPVATFRPTRVITVKAAAGYTVSTYDSSGTLADDSEFSGLTFQGSIRHTLNRQISHEIRFARNIIPGFRSNFTDLWEVQYGIRTRLTSSLNVNASLVYEDFETSGPGGERADRVLFYAGSGLQITPKWILGLSYAYALKDSDQAGRDYSQNRITLDLTYRF